MLWSSVDCKRTQLVQVMVFIGDDWAEDHVRHKALEVERR